jgi:ATP-dependent DNA helicase 2 subunit 2
LNHHEEFLSAPEMRSKSARADSRSNKVFFLLLAIQCSCVLLLSSVPKKIARTRKDGHAHAQDDDDTLLLLDRKQPNESPRSNRIRLTEASPSSSKSPTKAKPLTNPNDSETEEEEEEEEMLLDAKKPATPAPFSSRNMPLPTPARSISPEINPGRAPGRIIGSTYPLADFKKNLAHGDVVTKAVEDLGVVITEIVMRPFSSRRSAELLECMTALRDTSLKVRGFAGTITLVHIFTLPDQEDEIDAWNV